MLDKFFRTIEKIVPAKYQWVLNHEGFKRYFANTGWMFFGQVFSLLVSFFIGAWLARYLGPENYGTVSYVIAFAGLFSFIASLGVDGILNRELVANPEKRDELMGTAFRLKLIGGVSAFSVTVFAAFLFESSGLIRALIILYSLVFIAQAINIISIFFQANVLAKKNVRAVLIATFISSILKIILILSGGGVIWLTLIYLLDSVWQGLGYYLAYRHYNLKIKNWKFDKIIIKWLFKNSWLLMLSSAAAVIYAKIDQILIGNLLGKFEVGIYSIVVRLSETWGMVPFILCAALFPAIMNAKIKDEKLYNSRLQNLYLLMFFLSSSVILIILFLGGPIIKVLFGASYIESIPVLKIYVWSSIGLFLGVAVNQYLISKNLIFIIFLLNFLIMVVNLFLNFLLIPLFGLAGAALSTVIAYNLTSTIFFILIKIKYI